MIFAAVPLLGCASAFADDTGFAYAHDLRKEGGRLCMSEHFHSGSGSGKSKPAAQAAAARSWADFTNFEYGSAWARWSLAGSKSVRYTKDASGWSADVDARPCRG
ncbi:MAG: hypothetical protein WDN31_14565 [Hyphomicrobium sp.]